MQATTPNDYCQVTIFFISPTRIKVNQKYCTEKLSLQDIVYALVHRQMHLVCAQLLYEGREKEAAQVYHQYYPQELFIYLNSLFIVTVSQELYWTSYQQKSSTQNNTISLSGLMGRVVYAGKINFLLPLLKWGEIFQVGERTNYGLGKYLLG